MHALAGAGRVIGGRYRLRDHIGHGAMGTVWRARDELLDRDVAVKEVQVPPMLSERDKRALYERTFREARTAARLSHPGVVTVFDVVEEDSRPWIVMELVRARSLDRVLAEDGPLAPRQAAGVGQQLVGALATAHAAGVLHRDVKPSNVLLSADGRAVLTDFGIATFEGDAGLTQTGMVMGTPAFTPPERIRGEPATPSSDLWSLGATLYAAVQGRGPYQERGGALTTMNAVINEDAPAAPSAGRLGPVIAALMHKDPAARPDAATAAKLLSGVFASRPDGPAAAGPFPPEPTAPEAAAAGAATAMGGALPARPAETLPSPVLPAQPGPPASFPPRAGGAGAGGTGAAGTKATGAAGGGAAGTKATGTGAAGAARAGAARAGAARAGAARAGAAGAGAAAGAFATWPQAAEPPYAAPTYPQPAAFHSPSATPYQPPATPHQPSATPYQPPATPYQPPAAYRPSAPAYQAPAVLYPPRSYGPLPPGARQQGRPGRRTLLIGCAVAAILIAGFLLVVALARHKNPGHSSAAQDQPATGPASPASRPHTTPGGEATLPAGYTWYSQPGASTGTAAGFRLAMPQGWHVTRNGLATYIRAPSGGGFMEVDLTPHTYLPAMTEARWLQLKTRQQGKFPGYRRISLRPVSVHGASGAEWTFSWLEPGAGRVVARDYLFNLTTTAGSQSYALYGSTPAPAWSQASQFLTEALTTFQPLS